MGDWLKARYNQVFKPSAVEPTILSHRRRASHKAAVVFVHGFTGHLESTWGSFIELALNDADIANWDVYSLGYPTALRIDLADFWSADPPLDIIATQLRTSFSVDPLVDYEAVAIVAHSMGGLAVQRAICDHKPLRDKLTHLLLYGTPSRGIAKARFGRMLKRQLKDMQPSSSFITNLRKHWDVIVGSPTNFELRVVAGNRDEFVGGAANLGAFPEVAQRVVAGNHVQIVRSQSADSENYRIFSRALSRRDDYQTVVDGAEVALEFRRFRQVVQALEPGAKGLDENGIVTLCLALEGLNRRDDALRYLGEHDANRTSSEVMCVLAGRLKRQWLAAGVAEDRTKARDLYCSALEVAVATKDSAQAYYSAINIAYIDLMSAPPASEIGAEVHAMANLAIEHCNFAPVSHWQLATQGEAKLILGDMNGAMESYKLAIEKCASPRDRESMATQALSVANRVYGHEGAKQIGKVLGVR
ncbi:alpha/beta fold hydrolase [Mesorhizobium sp. M0088]|uniref:alpha/beta fold hydrolase n=1 Tax=Mesorhizobium sp. M0088 TaxID=2956873 RepID=UPI0033397670